MTEEWTKWEKEVINGIFPLHRAVSFSDHSAVFQTEYPPLNLPNALLKLVPAIPTLKETQLAHWAAAATLAHPNLIRLLEAGRCQLRGLQFLFVVMEYAQLTLEEILSQHALAPEALRKALRPILASLAFLHRNQLVQGALKPSNILLVNQQLKLASDTVRPSGESAASIASSSVYDPPESGDGSFSTAGDIWSLGVFMVEALTQCRPSWPGRHSSAAVLPETLPPQFVQIIRRCLSRNPAHRPAVAELEAEINTGPETPVRRAPMPHALVSPTLIQPTLVQPTLVQPTLVRPTVVPPEAQVTETAMSLPAMAEMTVGDEALVASTLGGEALVAETPREALVAGAPAGEALARGTPVAGTPATGTLAAARYPVLSPPRFPILRPAEPVDPIPAQLEGEEPELATVVLPAPKRRSFVPAGAAILVVAIAVWIGLRLPGSQPYSIPTALPAATAQNPATAAAAPTEMPAAAPAETSNARPSDGAAAPPTGGSKAVQPYVSTAAPSEVPTASLDPGFADPQTVVASSSVLHEEAPDVPVSALETIRGHIKLAVRVTVDGSGNVVQARLINHSPSEYFTRLAIESARKWKFVAADNPASRQWLLRFEFTRDGATAHANNPRTSRTDRSYRKTGAVEMRQAKIG